LRPSIHTATAFVAHYGAAALFILFGPYTAFALAGWLDPWFYTGYFTHFSYLLQQYGVTYYVSRLPWILPGLAVFHLASPQVATVLLHALAMATGCTALYLTVECHYGKLAGLAASVALLTNPYYAASNAGDYPDGAAIAYGLVAMGFFLRPTKGRFHNELWGGLFLALSGYTNLAALPMLVGIVVIPAWRHRRSLRALAGSVVRVFAGGVAATLPLMGVSKVTIHYFPFFWPQIFQTYMVRSDPRVLAEYLKIGNGWLPDAHRLMPPLILCLAGAVFWLCRWLKTESGFREAYLSLVTTCVLFAITEWGLHSAGLQVEYRSSYILAPLIMFAGFMLGECIRWGWRADSRMAQALWVVVPALGLALPFYFADGIEEQAITWKGMAILAAVLCACVAALRRGRMLVSVAACCLLIAGLFLGPASDSAIGHAWWKSKNAADFDTLMRIERILDANLGSRRARFWMDHDETAGPLYYSACSLYIFILYDFTGQLASAPADEIGRYVDSSTTLVHITQDPAKIAVRDALLESRGIPVTHRGEWRLPSRWGDIHVMLEDVQSGVAIH
jgi:hypothetical protein